jgi:predicted CXXCH cytochrome family protein
MPRTVRLMLLALTLAVQSSAGSQGSRGSRLDPRATKPAEHPPVTAADGPACTRCHDDMTTRRVLHGPVAASRCSTCHVVDTVAGQRRVGLKAGASSRDTAALCITCHEDIGERLKQPYRHAPVAAGNCTACHDPHGSPFRYQLPDESTRACTTCHEDIAQALAEKHVHEPTATSCQICHDPHAASRPWQMRAPGNTVCLACHVDAPVDAALIDDAMLFGRHPSDKVRRLVATGPRIALDASLVSGHPTIAHPVDARPDPNHKGRTLGCASCHNPHGSAGGKLFRFGATSVSSLCVRCHAF